MVEFQPSKLAVWVRFPSPAPIRTEFIGFFYLGDYMIIEKEQRLEDEITSGPDLILKTVCFNLKDTLECGQCFRWKRIDNNLGENRYISEYIGVISDRVIRIRQINEYIYVYSNVKENLKETIEYYFDLYNNYDRIEREISTIDKTIEKAVKNSSGIHILNQATFETSPSYHIVCKFLQ
jgi:hypothetical protein